MADLMKSIGCIKRGDTFSFTADIVDETTGQPLTGACANLKCQGKYSSGSNFPPEVEMSISETSTPGTYLFAANSTDNWVPNSRMLFDIQYSANGIISSSETFYVEIIGDVTDG
ncbi:MAG: hypothetical protein VB119_06935 [Candidatus Metalachnospira sp.]|nr:hypothetical protein [Candidatus Metalachnospira sp.]